MKGKAAYLITTALYAIVGIIALVTIWISVTLRQDLVLFLVSVGAAYVAFDNVGCERRKECYLGKK